MKTKIQDNKDIGKDMRMHLKSLKKVVERNYSDKMEVSLWDLLWGCLGTFLIFFSFIDESLIKFIGGLFFFFLIYLNQR